MKHLGLAIAFCGLCATATYLEVTGHNADRLWIGVGVWIFGYLFSDN